MTDCNLSSSTNTYASQGTNQTPRNSAFIPLSAISAMSSHRAVVQNTAIPPRRALTDSERRVRLSSILRRGLELTGEDEDDEESSYTRTSSRK